MKIGIDFGTSFSLPAGVINGLPSTLLPNNEYGIPSVFYYDSEVNVLIGNAAEDNANYQPHNVKRDIKMEINSHDDSFIADGRKFTKKEIIGYIFKEIVSVALQESERRELKSQTIEGAVISVPAAFTVRELTFIREAAQLSVENGGPAVNVLGFIREPVAAAIAYFNAPNSEDEKTILVYDLGGGTCDVAIVRSDKNAKEWYTVIDSDMKRIGGRDWDEVIIRLIKQKFREQAGSISFDATAESDIRKQAIRTKHILSKQTIARVSVPIAGKNHTCVITVEEFEQATSSILQNTMNIVENMMKKCSSKVDFIVCVGGSSNMPQVRKALMQMYPNILVKLYEPEKAIAFGAAIYAEHLTETQYLRDICKFSYGVRFIENYEKYKDKNRLIILNGIIKGSQLPANYKTTGTPVEDGETSLCFAVYESECIDPIYKPDCGTEIGRVNVRNLKDSKKGDTFIVTLEIDQSGLMHVKAVEEKTEKSASADIQLKDF